MMSYRITGLRATGFSSLFGLGDAALAARGAQRVRVDANPGYPDRVTLRDLAIGETALLVNHTHQPADGPYRASHAIYIGERDAPTFDRIDTVPEVLRSRVLSLRAFDAAHLMVDADLVDGAAVETLLEQLFASPAVAYVQAHFAKRGCYAARIERANQTGQSRSAGECTIDESLESDSNAPQHR